MQQVAVGNILDGKVTGITNFGAFVEIEKGVTGLVHISEVSKEYVKEIHNHISKDQQVKVKVLSISGDGKISLSIKKAEVITPVAEKRTAPPPDIVMPPQKNSESSFEDMIAKFKQSSDDKMSDLKKHIDVKRGSGRRNPRV